MARRERNRGTRLVAGPEDEALFRETLKDVEPLKKRAARITPEIYHGTTPMPDRPPATGRPHPSQPPGPARLAAPARPGKLPPLHLGGAVGTDRRTAERLRRGRMAVEARLDLHGRTQDQAHRELLSFIRRTAAAGMRCVLVVTGKG
ncbi:MAG: Smr/MutS family protein, partial [Alphaproteobacteria bacterium]